MGDQSSICWWIEIFFSLQCLDKLWCSLTLLSGKYHTFSRVKVDQFHLLLMWKMCGAVPTHPQGIHGVMLNYLFIDLCMLRECMSENNQDIHYIYLGNKEICCIFKTCCTICVLFCTKWRLLHNFIFLLLFLVKIIHFS